MQKMIFILLMVLLPIDIYPSNNLVHIELKSKNKDTLDIKFNGYVKITESTWKLSTDSFFVKKIGIMKINNNDDCYFVIKNDTIYPNNKKNWKIKIK